jgi:hypothetical protein
MAEEWLMKSFLPQLHSTNATQQAPPSKFPTTNRPPKERISSFYSDFTRQARRDKPLPPNLPAANSPMEEKIILFLFSFLFLLLPTRATQEAPSPEFAGC